MKVSILILATMLFVLGCKKDGTNQLIIGTWELRTTIGGWAGVRHYEPGNGNLAIFYDKNQYTHKTVSADTAYSYSYYYKLIKTGDCGENIVLTSKDDGMEFKQQASISGDTLSLATPACYADGGTSVYIRLH